MRRGLQALPRCREVISLQRCRQVAEVLVRQGAERFPDGARFATNEGSANLDSNGTKDQEHRDERSERFFGRAKNVAPIPMISYDSVGSTKLAFLFGSPVRVL